MEPMRRSLMTKGAALVLLALIAGAAAGGCGRARERFARRPPPPTAAVQSALKSADAHYRLGRLYLQRFRHRDAAAEFRKALAVAPDDVRSLNALGVALDALGRYADAATVYTRALELDPGLDYVLNNLGYSHLLSGNRAAAAAAFAKALELNPRNTIARNNLSRLQGGTDQAVASPAADSPATSPADALPGSATPALFAAPGPVPTVTPASLPAGGAAPAAKAAGAPPAVNALGTSAAPASVPAPAAAAALEAATKAGAKTDVATPVLAAAPGPVPTAAQAPTIPPPARQPAKAPVPPATMLVPVSGSGSGSVLLRRVSSSDLRRETVVEVSNAGNQAKLLTDLVAFLTAEGFRVETGPAEPPRGKTMILYRDGALQPAWQVAKSFPGDQEMKKTGTFASSNATVRVLLGRDMAAQRQRFAVLRREHLAGTAGR